MALSPPPSNINEFNYQWIKWINRWFDDYRGLFGRFVTVKGLVTADSPYTVLATDVYIFCAPDSGAMTVNLPPGQDRRFYGIKNYASIGANTVTVVPDGAETIEGAASLVLSKGDEADLIYIESRTGWFIV